MRALVKIGVSFDEGSPKYRRYIGALRAAADQGGYGEEAELRWLAGSDVPLDTLTLDQIDGLILTGGADVEPARYGSADPAGVVQPLPGRDAVEIAILDAAFRRRLPILAICRGMQLLNVYLGGTLVEDLPGTTHQLNDEERHRVRIEGGSALGRLVGVAEGDATSSHHQAVKELGEGLRAVAWHADGTIEAIEWTSPMRKPWLGAVQWHPEQMGLDEPLAGPLLKGFLEAVSATSR